METSPSAERRFSHAMTRQTRSDGTQHPRVSEGVQPHQQSKHVKSDDVRILHLAGHVTYEFIFISTSFVLNFSVVLGRRGETAWLYWVYEY